MIIDNINVRVSSLEYKVDRLNIESADTREDMLELKEDMKLCRTDMKETNVYMKEINQKVMKNGKTRKADWVCPDEVFQVS
jgi:peptidoglycan hydrolase CwlO-like protein